MSIDNLVEYIKERCGMIGCNMTKFDCDKYLDCDVCLLDKLNEYKEEVYQKGREDAIEEMIEVADCEHADCFDCAYGSAEGCKLQSMLILRREI